MNLFVAFVFTEDPRNICHEYDVGTTIAVKQRYKLKNWCQMCYLAHNKNLGKPLESCMFGLVPVVKYEKIACQNS